MKLFNQSISPFLYVLRDYCGVWVKFCERELFRYLICVEAFAVEPTEGTASRWYFHVGCRATYESLVLCSLDMGLHDLQKGFNW